VRTDRVSIARDRRAGGAWRGLRYALGLRCPYCGRGRLTRSWFALREACEVCRLRFERDEQDDYWLGAYTLNFIVTEVVFALILAAVLIATWPNPPWTAIIVVGVVQMCVTPILFYPYAKALWLAIDLIFRRVQPDDFRS
jgi:uncharacterized protein (DUF983 family)